MKRPVLVFLSVVLVLAGQSCKSSREPASRTQEPWMKESIEKVKGELISKYGAGVQVRLERGVNQVAGFWRPQDGAASVFEDFIRTHFAGDQAALDELFKRMEFALESLDGHMLEISRDFRMRSDLDLGPIYPFDEILAGYDPSAHVLDDFFGNKLAFAVLLNFPVTTLEQRLQEGEKWTRRQWAEARLGAKVLKTNPGRSESCHCQGDG